MGQTGQSEAIHSPEECASTVFRRTVRVGLVDRGGLHHGDLVLAERLAHEIEARSRAVRSESFVRSPAPRRSSRMVAVMVFSGLTRTVCALAKAEAMRGDALT